MLQVVLGFFAMGIAGYILAHAVAGLADAAGLSGTVAGMTLLSLATTLPEKFVAVLSGTRGHTGILVASTAGSNVFLLTLCLGVLLLASGGPRGADTVNALEVAVMWASSALFALIVLLGSRRWAGAVLLLLYAGFLVLEFTVFRR